MEKPRAYRIDATTGSGGEDRLRTRDGRDVEEAADPFLDAVAAESVAVKPRRRLFSWLTLFASATGALVFLTLSISVQNLIVEQIRSNALLGYVALGLAILALLGLVGFLLREAISILRAARIEKLSRDVAAARLSDDLYEGRRLSRALVALYASRPESARGRDHVEAIESDLIDARGRLDIVERALLTSLDAQARSAVATASSRVALITTISPRAIIDVLFVLGASVSLVRRVSDIYGGRPGLLGFLRISRHVLAHLTITGGVALGEGLAQQILGAGVAARLSAKLGEGVVNGLLTARVGLSAIAVCRPMGFSALPAPTLGEVASSFIRSGGATQIER